MLDSAADKPGEEWCYLSKSTTVIGVPFQPDVTQITFDGSVYTRNAELCFFYGGKHQPFLLDGEAHAGPEPLSFDFVRKTFQYEYARRAAKAPKLVTIAAPAMLTAAERTQAFTRQFGVIPQDKVIAR